MGLRQTSKQWRQQDLARDAVENRLQALSEYLAVYRASYASSGSSRLYARIRVIRNDMARLRAWWWYLGVQQRGASFVLRGHKKTRPAFRSDRAFLISVRIRQE